MNKIEGQPINEGVGPALMGPAGLEIISFIVRARQHAFRTVNAFPTNTEYSREERAEIIKLIPPLDGQGAIRGRLGAMVMYNLLTLDLARIEGSFDWRTGAEVDEAVEEFLYQLKDDHQLARQLGVTCLEGPIPKKHLKANSQAMAQSLGAEFNRASVFHVVRIRRVASLAIRGTRDQFLIRKRSDFALVGAPPEVTRGALHLSRGGLGYDFAADYDLNQDQLQGMNRELSDAFSDAIQSGIDSQAEWLIPEGMNYFAARKYKVSPGPKPSQGGPEDSLGQ